jgi:chemotaxis protein MotB
MYESYNGSKNPGIAPESKDVQNGAFPRDGFGPSSRACSGLIHGGRMYNPQQPPHQQAQHPLPPHDLGYQNMLTNVSRPSRAPWVLLVLVLGGAGAGLWWLNEQRTKALAEAKAAAELDRAKLALEETVKRLEAEKAELTAARDALAKSVEEKSSELAELKGTFEKLQVDMKDEIARGDIQLTHGGGRLRVDLVDKILFESGDARISKRGESVLARVGAVLASIEDKQIQVSGHTDRNPISEKLQAQYPTNWELSVVRATNVVRFLQERASIPPERLVASGHGEFQPVASNKTPGGRARNRRIEILLTPSLAPRAISKAKLKEQRADAKPSAAQDSLPGAARQRGARP